jgi:hypothetical protein
VEKKDHRRKGIPMKHKQLILQALNSILGDDHIRAEIAFCCYTDKQMNAPYGQSKDTPKQILEGYQERARKIQAAINYVKDQNEE